MPDAAPPDQPTETTQTNGAPPRGSDGKFLPAADAPVAAPAATPEAPAEPPKPKARDHAEYARRRHALSEKARQLAEQRRQVEAQQQQWASEREAMRRELEALKQETGKWASGNPLKIAQERGIDIDAAIREYVQGATPEQMSKKALEEAAQLRRELAERDTRAQQEEQRRQQEGMQRARAAARVAFVRDISANAEKYPYLNHEYDEQQLADITGRFDDWAASQGKTYTYEQAASELERLAKLRYDTLEPKRSALFRSTEPPSAAPPVSGASGNGRLVTSPGTARRSAPEPAKLRPAAMRRMTREEEEEADKAALRKAFEADRLARSKEGKAT